MTRRLSGLVQFGAIESAGVTFQLDQSFVDLMHTLTEKDDLPPEYHTPLSEDESVGVENAPEDSVEGRDDGVESSVTGIGEDQ